MRIEDIMLVPLGETVKLYDYNYIREVYIVVLNKDEEEFLCVDSITHEVITSFTEKTFNQVYLVRQKDFNIKEEILKCVTNIRVKYPNEKIFFSDYKNSSFIEIYRERKNEKGTMAYKELGEKTTHTELSIEYLSEDDINIIEEIEKEYIKKPSKLDLWTISVIDRKVGEDLPSSSEMYMIECDDVADLKDNLKILQDKGQDMEYVTVFPPKSGYIATNFVIA